MTGWRRRRLAAALLASILPLSLAACGAERRGDFPPATVDVSTIPDGSSVQLTQRWAPDGALLEGLIVYLQLVSDATGASTTASFGLEAVEAIEARIDPGRYLVRVYGRACTANCIDGLGGPRTICSAELELAPASRLEIDLRFTRDGVEGCPATRASTGG